MGDQWHRRGARILIGTSSDARLALALTVLVVLFALSYATGYLFGGAAKVAPHWFYLPVLFAGVRFGLWGVVVAAPAAGLLAGPLLPADVASGTRQPASDWLSRGVAFVLVGAFVSILVNRGMTTVQDERRAKHIEREVRRAVSNGELVLHYQPIVAIGSGEVVAAEALIRWQHPTRGFLLPADFLEDVEHVSSLAGWVLTEACQQISTWTEQLARPLDYVSVNISSDNLAEFDFVHQVVNAIRASSIDPHQLCIEVTERTLIDDLDLASARLSVLRSVGVRIAVDDFGTGHASLHYLQELPVDIVKIDRSFVSGSQSTRRNHAIVKAVVELAEALGATTVAEGVETSAQLELLRRAGCRDDVQGFLFSRAVPADEFGPLCDRPFTLVKDASEGER
ncbi:MAG: putative bifunctional diguanylate cyclase/phosphodiesterase [Acidimicrobiales bacterium]